MPVWVQPLRFLMARARTSHLGIEEAIMWQPKRYQWIVIWVTFALTGYVTVLGEPFTALTPFLIAAGALLVWMLQVQSAQS